MDPTVNAVCDNSLERDEERVYCHCAVKYQNNVQNQLYNKSECSQTNVFRIAKYLLSCSCSSRAFVMPISDLLRCCRYQIELKKRDNEGYTHAYEKTAESKTIEKLGDESNAGQECS